MRARVQLPQTPRAFRNPHDSLDSSHRFPPVVPCHNRFTARSTVPMTLPVNPPAGPVTLSSNARTVLEKRYLVKNDKGKPVEQPEDLFWRVATVVAEADRRYGASDGAVEQ